MPDDFDNPHLDVQPEVQAALNGGQAVVALESTIISHGMPYPRNVETAKRVEAMVRSHGATPATIAILDGRMKVGLDDTELEYLGVSGQKVTKASRRDLPFILSRGQDGATTVAATMIIAAMAGIRVFATGGIGGVHRGVDKTMDISADLNELSRNDIVVVCAGIKSVLDIGRTLEYLETAGVPVVGFRTDNVPAFYARDSGFPVDYRVEDPSEIAAAMKMKDATGIRGGILLTNPVPEEHALDPGEIGRIIEQAIAAMNELGISGKDTTPFLLSRIAEQTGGRSLNANIELVLNNARLAAEVAVQYSLAGNNNAKQ